MPVTGACTGIVVTVTAFPVFSQFGCDPGGCVSSIFGRSVPILWTDSVSTGWLAQPAIRPQRAHHAIDRNEWNRSGPLLFISWEAVQNHPSTPGIFRASPPCYAHPRAEMFASSNRALHDYGHQPAEWYGLPTPGKTRAEVRAPSLPRRQKARCPLPRA